MDKNWIEDVFPEAVSNYHLCEHSHQFTNTVFTDEAVLKRWTNEQKQLPLQDKVMEVTDNKKKIVKVKKHCY